MKFRGLTIWLVFCLLMWGSACEMGPPRYDIIIQNGLIIDGSGAPGYVSDIGIRKGIIQAVDDLSTARARKRVDAGDRVVSPGFIDLHTHVERLLLDLPQVENYTRQGVTTVLGGNCGSSPLPIGDFLRDAEKLGIAPNLALLVGHNTVRRAVIGTQNREPTAEEMDRMKEHVSRAMHEGAFGLSTGLRYIPGFYSETDEVVALARVTAISGGFYATHLRSEELEAVEAVLEAIEIGRRSGIPVHISHHKLMGRSMWGKSVETLSEIDEAVAQGLDVTFDQYPYTATSTGLRVLFPAWSLAGGQDSLLSRLEDPKTRDRIKQGIMFNIRFRRGGGDPASIVVISFRADSSLEGKDLAEITRLKGRQNTIEGAAETLLELQTAGGGSGIYHCLAEEDVLRILKHPLGSVASDGGTVRFGAGLVHPRNYGTFPRILAEYVRHKKALTLEEAVRKMTLLPSQRLGLTDRGQITEGMRADLVIFDPVSVQDRSTFPDPHKYPDGINEVLVNGILVVEKGRTTGARPGMILRHR